MLVMDSKTASPSIVRMAEFKSMRFLIAPEIKSPRASHFVGLWFARRAGAGIQAEPGCRTRARNTLHHGRFRIGNPPAGVNLGRVLMAAFDALPAAPNNHRQSLPCPPCSNWRSIPSLEANAKKGLPSRVEAIYPVWQHKHKKREDRGPSAFYGKRQTKFL